MRSLHLESIWLDGVRAALLKLEGNINYLGDVFTVKQKEVYNRAIHSFLLSDRQNLLRWIEGVEEMYFVDHQKDKKGKLVSVKITFDKPRKI